MCGEGGMPKGDEEDEVTAPAAAVGPVSELVSELVSGGSDVGAGSDVDGGVGVGVVMDIRLFETLGSCGSDSTRLRRAGRPSKDWEEEEEEEEDDEEEEEEVSWWMKDAGRGCGWARSGCE